MVDVTSERAACADALGDELLKRSKLFMRWEAMKQEILLHKWYQSEKAGYDIGWERAATNWFIHHGCRTLISSDESIRKA